MQCTLHAKKYETLPKCIWKSQFSNAWNEQVALILFGRSVLIKDLKQVGKITVNNTSQDEPQ